MFIVIVEMAHHAMQPVIIQNCKEITCTAGIAAVVYFGQDNQTEPSHPQADFEFRIFLLAVWLPLQGNRTQYSAI